MKSVKSLRIVVLMMVAAFAVAMADQSDARCGLFKKFRGNNCCQTSCCEAEPVCCEAEPVCCDPEPVCCEANTCCEKKRCGLFSRLHNRRNNCCESSCGCEEVVSDCGCEAVVEDCGCQEASACCGRGHKLKGKLGGLRGRRGRCGC